MKSKYFLSFAIFIVGVFSLFILALQFLPVAVSNKSNDEVCLVSLKMGLINHAENIQLNNNGTILFFDLVGFSDQISVSYYHGKCRDNASPINLSCILDRQDICELYIDPNNSLDCECYE